MTSDRQLGQYGQTDRSLVRSDPTQSPPYPSWYKPASVELHYEDETNPYFVYTSKHDDASLFESCQRATLTFVWPAPTRGRDREPSIIISRLTAERLMSTEPTRERAEDIAAISGHPEMPEEVKARLATFTNARGSEWRDRGKFWEFQATGDEEQVRLWKWVE